MPAMSMVSYAAGTRLLSLIGGTISSFAGPGAASRSTAQVRDTVAHVATIPGVPQPQARQPTEPGTSGRRIGGRY